MDNKRVFISFAVEDKVLRDFLVGQKRNDNIDISFMDYSVKEPWDEKWKTNCRTRIKGCDGLIGIITTNTPKADGQLWELKCGYDEGVPTLLIHGYSVRVGETQVFSYGDCGKSSARLDRNQYFRLHQRVVNMARAAICIGINDYEHVSRLCGCENDARAIHERICYAPRLFPQGRQQDFPVFGNSADQDRFAPSDI